MNKGSNYHSSKSQQTSSKVEQKLKASEKGKKAKNVEDDENLAYSLRLEDISDLKEITSNQTANERIVILNENIDIIGGTIAKLHYLLSLVIYLFYNIIA